IVNLYNKRSPELVTKIRDGIRRKDPYLLRHAAHNLRGMVSNFASESALQAAHLIEQAGEKEDFSQADYLFENLVKELTDLNQALQKIQENNNFPSLSSNYLSS
ncbi:MAG: Hpt domain-containing protein, partial [Candidatus Hinthialibacter sp.]